MKNIMKNVLLPLSFTVFVFGFAGWVYIAFNATNHPETLALPLTHLLPFPREDTFGIVCFGLSFVSLFIYMYMREERRGR
jgi:hypothetical protein